jgi:hypothetical protein
MILPSMIPPALPSLSTSPVLPALAAATLHVGRAGFREFFRNNRGAMILPSTILPCLPCLPTSPVLPDLVAVTLPLAFMRSTRVVPGEVLGQQSVESPKSRPAAGLTFAVC